MKFAINKPLEDIKLRDIQLLIENRIPESAFLDYKMTTYGSTNSDKRELLKDVSAFANANGGDLILGIEEDKHNQAFRIVGVEIKNITEEITRLEQIIYSGLEPKLDTVKTRYFEIEKQKYIIIIRIEASPLFPHMVSFQHTNKFYIRKSDRNLLLDAYELRNVFLKSENIIEDIRKQNKSRITNIYADEAIVPIQRSVPKVIINFIPYNFSDSKNYIDFSKIDLDLKFPEQRINFDGLLGYGMNNKGIESYCQIYRNGMIEFVSTSDKMFGTTKNPFGEDEINVIWGNNNGYEYYLIRKCYFCFKLLKELNIQLPVYLFLTMTDTKGYRILYQNNNTYKLTNAIDRDLLELPEKEIKSYNIDMKYIVKDLLNMIWNSCGEKRSINFDEKGRWIGKDINFNK